jgi:hypothetical protein
MPNAFDQFDSEANEFDQFDDFSPPSNPDPGLKYSGNKETPKGAKENAFPSVLEKSISLAKTKDGKLLSDTGFAYIVEDMTSKAKSGDEFLSMPHNLSNPKVKSLEDTPEYILRGLPEDVARDLYEQYSKPGFDVISGQDGNFFQPTRAAKSAADFARFKSQNPDKAGIIESMGPNEAFMVGMGEGFYSVGEGVGLLEDRSPEQRAMDDALRSKHGGASAGKLTAQVLPFLVPGAAISNISSTPARIAAMGGLGATEGNIISRGEGQDANQIAKSTGIGFLIGTFGEAAIPAINSLGRKFAGSLKRGDISSDQLQKITIDADGNVSPEFQRILDDNGTTIEEFAEGVANGFDDPVMNAQRKKVFDDMGLDITEAQRTRSSDLFNTQQDALRREGPVKDAIERQDELLDQITKGQINSIGGVAQRANSTPIEAITDKAVQLDDEISELYKKAREQAPDDKVIKFSAAIENLRSNAPQNQMSNGTVQALRMKMRDMGVMDDEWKAIGKVDLNTSEELRKFANRIYGNANPEGREIIRQFKNNLDDDVFKSMDGLKSSPSQDQLDLLKEINSELEFLEIDDFDEANDMFITIASRMNVPINNIKSDLMLENGIYKFNILASSDDAVGYFKTARKAKADFEKGLDPDTINKFDKSKTSLVRDILTSTLEEDDLTKRVLSRGSKYKARHLQELKNYLTTGTEGQVAQGLQAWNDIRAAALQQIKDKSFTGAVTKTGTQSLSRSRLEGAIKAIGPSKMDVLFSPREREFLKKLMAVATLKEPPPGTFMGSGPSSPAIKELTNVVANKIPVFREIYGGVASKIRERANDRKVLELIDDAKVIADQNSKVSLKKFRSSPIGAAVGSVPAPIIASEASEEEN